MRELESKQSKIKQAQEASRKQASLGTDIELNDYVHSADELPYQEDPSAISPDAKERMLASGIILDDKNKIK